MLEYQPASRPRSHESVDAGSRPANFPSCFPLLPSCLFTRHLWLKEGGKTAFTKVCPSAALVPRQLLLRPPLYLGQLLLAFLLHCGHVCQRDVCSVSIALYASLRPYSPRPLLPPRRPPAETQAAASISGAALNVHHNRPRTFPGLPTPNLTCSAHVPTATKRPPAPIPAGPPAHLLQHLHSPSPPTNASHHRNCGSNTCRPLRTRRQATSTPNNNNNNNHTKTCPSVRQTPLRHPLRQEHPPIAFRHPVAPPTPPSTMSHNDDAAVQELIRKIDRENAIINAARQMSQATNNPAVSSRVDSQIREATRNINYFEQTLRDIQTRQMGNLSVGGGPAPPQHGMPPNGQSGRGSNNQSGYDTQQADYGAPGPGGYSAGAGGMMPPRAPYAPPGPEERSSRQRPNYSKLGMAKGESVREGGVLTCNF